MHEYVGRGSLKPKAMYYLYRGDNFGTCLAIAQEKSILVTIIVSNMKEFKEGGVYSILSHYDSFSKLGTKSIYLALKEYEKENKRIRNMRLSHSQYKDD